MKEYPILIRSRREFYYSNEIKNSNPTVSPQRYRPKIECVMDSRFKKIGIGYGSKSMPYNKDALSSFITIISKIFIFNRNIVPIIYNIRKLAH